MQSEVLFWGRRESKLKVWIVRVPHRFPYGWDVLSHSLYLCHVSAGGMGANHSPPSTTGTPWGENDTICLEIKSKRKKKKIKQTGQARGDIHLVSHSFITLFATCPVARPLSVLIPPSGCLLVDSISVVLLEPHLSILHTRAITGGVYMSVTAKWWQGYQSELCVFLGFSRCQVLRCHCILLRKEGS